MKRSLKNLLYKSKVLQHYANTALNQPVKGLLVFCMLCFFNGVAQVNLVPNYSFENYTTCPTASGQVGYANPWTGTNNSSDYFNSCAPSGFLSVPSQSSGSFQYAQQGNAFAGLWMLNGYGNDYREYLQVLLLDTLENNECYFVRFYINLHNQTMYAVNNFGVYFSNSSFSTTWGPAPYSPQIITFQNSIINDTADWISIAGVYISNGGEQYISLGNFKNDLNTDTLNTGNGTYPGAYYYFDNISVIPIDSIPGGIPANAGNDVNVIPGDSVFIGQEISNLDCNWYNASGSLIASNTSGIYVQPAGDTYYVVEQNLCGSITYDTVNVNVSGVGIDEDRLSKTIELYPNPNNGSFSFGPFSSDITTLNIKVIDIIGKTVFNKTINSSERMFNLNLDSPNGVYMVFINNPNTNDSIVKRIVIQK
jgi:hypothetical protein